VTDSTARGEAIRIAGTIREVVHTPATWTARIAGKTHHAGSDGELVIDVDGAAVTVTLAATAIIDDGEEIKGAWGELVERAEGHFASSLAPAFEAGKLEIVKPAKVGAAIEIYGEVDRREFADDGGLRDAPSQRVAAVRALIMSTSDDRTARIDREIARRYPPAQRPVRPSWFVRRRLAAAEAAKDPRSKELSNRLYRHEPAEVYVHYGALGVGLVLALVTLLTRSPTAAIWTFAVAIIIALFRLRTPMTPFRILDRSYRRFAHIADFVYPMSFMFYVISIGMSPIFFDRRAVLVIASVALLIATSLGLLQQQTARLHRKVLAALRWDGASINVYATIEGIVKDPTPAVVGDRQAAIGRGTGFSEGIGSTRGSSNPDTEVWQRFHGDGTFLVKVPDHGSIEVSPQHVVWSTTVRGRETSSRDGADYEVFEIVPVNGKVIATGWIEKDATSGIPQLRAKGTTPAILIATGPDGEPRDWLVRSSRSAMLSIALVGVLDVLAVVLWLWVVG
jgi:hypothetical protein